MFSIKFRILGRLFGRKSKEEARVEKQKTSKKEVPARGEVGNRSAGLGRCGINSAELGTEEVVEVFIKF